jgi:hypothetical protein
VADLPPTRPRGQTFADPAETAQATEVATAQLNAHAKPWVPIRRLSGA